MHRHPRPTRAEAKTIISNVLSTGMRVIQPTDPSRCAQLINMKDVQWVGVDRTTQRRLSCDIAGQSRAGNLSRVMLAIPICDR